MSDPWTLDFDGWDPADEGAVATSALGGDVGCGHRAGLGQLHHEGVRLDA